MTHYHAVQRPGKERTSLPCYHVAECPYAAATPEEIGIWLESQDRSIPFKDWLRIHRMPPAVPADKSGIVVHPSVSDAIRESIHNPKKTQTVPVTIEQGDGRKWVVGSAEVEVRDGWVAVSFNLNAKEALQMRIQDRGIGPFSISTKGEPPSPADILRAEGVIPLEPRIKWICLDPKCDYVETHQHGAACTKDCHCNRNGRVD